MVTRHSSACLRSRISGGRLAHAAACADECWEGNDPASAVPELDGEGELTNDDEGWDMADVVREGGMTGPLSNAPARPPSFLPTPPTPDPSSLPEADGAKWVLPTLATISTIRS